ncbi:putative polyamine oxidase 5 [Pseudocercospora fuligena]|uniref:Putative polyamine oxidase 5 n=1 Tax=Pseudocercospora fuligena TaxID=685502 RepID=A0A8H6RTK5_9PEZI|nr:putative polyamine oxidase 5 [Pseudocercospora fuligena]
MATQVGLESRHYDVLVLGAGMSGLACAAKLHESDYFKGKNRLKVLEGRNRIGGRINAVYVNGNRLDTGAKWIHGIGTKDKPNPLMDILPHKKYKQLEGSVTFRPAQRGSRAVEDDDWVEIKPTRSLHIRDPSSSKDLIIPAKVAEIMMNALWPMIESLHETAAEVPEREAARTTMLHAIAQNAEFREAFKSLPQEYHLAMNAMPQFIETMEAAPLAAQSAEHSVGNPGMSLLEFGIEDFDGDQVFLQDGYIAIVNEIAKPLLQAGLIELDTHVLHIDWKQSPIKVVTSKGAYTASEVVCTLPLGVLQSHLQATSPEAKAKPFFQPDLPSDKQTAIQSLGFGTLDKILLVYDRPWWNDEPYTSIFKKGLVSRPFGPEDQVDSQSKAAPDSLMGFTDELAGIEIHQDGTATPGLRVLSLVNLDSLTGKPVLSAFVSCANAVEVEAMSDAQAGGIVHRALTSWLGCEPPPPDAIHVTRWASDEFSLGSYSHMITGLSETKHRVAFQDPIRNREGGVLRFAGEHTSRNHFATVHGALLSGRREADAIVSAHKP